MAHHIQDLIASRRAVLGGLAALPLLNLDSAAASPAATSRALSFHQHRPDARRSSDRAAGLSRPNADRLGRCAV